MYIVSYLHDHKKTSRKHIFQERLFTKLLQSNSFYLIMCLIKNFHVLGVFDQHLYWVCESIIDDLVSLIVTSKHYELIKNLFSATWNNKPWSRSINSSHSFIDIYNQMLLCYYRNVLNVSIINYVWRGY